MSVRLRSRPMPETLRMVARDGMKVTAGLAVSVALAMGLPRVAEFLPRATELVATALGVKPTEAVAAER
jgi:hypothetical protein